LVFSSGEARGITDPSWHWRGTLLVKAGIAAAAIPRRKLTRRKLADAMLKLKENPVFKNNSEVTGSRMKLENGVRSAVDIIEQVIQKIT